MPANAFLGGNDFDGDPIYVGRALHNGDTLVAKIVPKKQIAFVSWHGEAIPKDHFEVLCGSNLMWLPCYDHVIPGNAVVCGKTAIGQPVYVGRGHYEGSLSVGKISSVHRALFIPFKNAERRLESYEILVAREKRKEGWAVGQCESSCEDVKRLYLYPPTPEDTKPPMGNIKPMPLPMPMPMPLPRPSPPPAAHDPYFPRAPSPQPFDPPPPYQPVGGVPVYPSISPPPSHHSHSRTPSNTQPAATPFSPKSFDTWVVSSANYTPPKAVQAGHDVDLSPILVCRSFHNGDLLPGKAIPSRACAYVSHDGQEITKTDFEILIGEGYEWVPAADGTVPAGAVEAGRTASGESLFVGRAQYCGSLTPGKIQPSHRALYIAFGGCERRITYYEVLVRRHGGDSYRDEVVKICY